MTSLDPSSRLVASSGFDGMNPILGTVGLLGFPWPLSFFDTNSATTLPTRTTLATTSPTIAKGDNAELGLEVVDSDGTTICGAGLVTVYLYVTTRGLETVAFDI